MASYRPTQIRKPSDETDFEKNCVVLFKDLLNDPNVRRVGTRGQGQEGVDIIGKRNRDSRQLVGIQCKLKSARSKLTEREVRDEVTKALKFKPNLSEYFIVATSKDDTLLVQLGTQLSQDQEAKGRTIHIEVWGWDRLEENINQSEAAKAAFDPGFSPSIVSQNRTLQAVLAGQNRLATRDQIAALNNTIQKAASDLVETRLPSPYADRELREGLSRALRRRGFAQTNIARELADLAGRAIEGDLVLASNLARAEICDRAARANVSADTAASARRFRDKASEIDSSRDLYIIDALLKELEGDPDGTLRALKQRADPETRSVLFTSLVRQRGRKEAVNWARSESLTPAHLNAAGALNFILSQIENGDFEQALADVSMTPDAYFEECPALRFLHAQLALASILPADQKAMLFQGLPPDPKILQLGVGTTRHEKIELAKRHLGRLLELSAELDLVPMEGFLSEFELWLLLEDPNSVAGARARVAIEITDPEKTLGRVRLALAYDIPFNRDALQRHLLAQKELGGWTPDERFAAFLLAYHSRKLDKLSDFFARHHDDLFGQSDLNRSALAGIEIESLVRTGRLEDARLHITLHHSGADLTTEQADELERVVDLVEKGDEIERFRHRYEESNNLTDLRVLVAGLRDRRDVRQLAIYMPLLARATKSREDFDLAIKSLFETRRDTELVAFTEELPALQQLDEEYSSLKGWALFRLGHVLEARSIAKDLLLRRNVPSDRELAINTSIETGDWGNVQAILAREAPRADASIAAIDLIRLANLALEVDSPYVDHFRDAALRKAPDDPQINLAAYTLALRRGSEYQGSEAHGWFQKALEQSGSEGPVQPVPLREVLDQARGWSKYAENIDQLLRRGDAPLFIAAKALRRQLIDLTLGQILRNTDEPGDRRIKYPVFAFTGALPQGDMSGARSVALDITSIITLDYLDILEKALAHFDRVVIAPKTLSALFLERQFLKFHQPSEMEKAQRIQAMIAAGRLKVAFAEPSIPSARSKEICPDLAALIDASERDRGLVVLSAPVFKPGSFLEERSDMSAYAPILTDTLEVLSFLSTSGKIDSERNERAETFLKQVDIGWTEAKRISADSRLYLDRLSVNYLYHVGLLETLSQSVSSVFVHADLDKETRNLLRYGLHADELLKAIERIRAVIGAGIESGRIHFSGRHPVYDSSDDQKDDTLETSPTLDLISDLSGIDIVVVDDRCLNKLPIWTDTYGRSVPVTSSLGILAALRGACKIDNRADERARHRLRAAGYYAVPSEPGEILHHIAGAPIADGEVRETPELRAVRESCSLPLIYNAFVSTEERWLNGIRHAVYKAIHEVWLKATDFEKALAQAAWLLSILPDPLEWCASPENDSAWAKARQQAIIQVGIMMIFIDVSSDRRLRYFAWLKKSILDPMQDKYPEIFDSAIDFVKQYIIQLVKTPS